MSRRIERESLRGSVNDAYEHVKKMIGNGRYDCDFKEETKDEIRLYVESWVLPPLRRAFEKVNKISLKKRLESEK